MALPRLPHTTPPAGDSAGVMEAAKMLVAAENPPDVADRAARTAEGVRLLVQLAELLQAGVVDTSARFNFPGAIRSITRPARRRHPPRRCRAGIGNGQLQRHCRALPKSVKRIAISSEYLYRKANYQDFQAYADVDLAIAADAEATLPALIEALRGLLPAASAREGRGKSAWADNHANALALSRANAAVGWDVQPITTARMCQELYGQIRKHDWALVNGTNFQNYWPQQLWQADKHYQYIGDGAGAYGLGYLPGAALGAAFAHAKQGRLAVAIIKEPRSDVLTPCAAGGGAQQDSYLYVVHNNRGYHQELMAVQDVANRRNRGIDRTQIGNVPTQAQYRFRRPGLKACLPSAPSPIRPIWARRWPRRWRWSRRRAGAGRCHCAGALR